MNEKLEFLEDLSHDLNVLVIHWLMQEIVEAKTARDDEHKALVELTSNIE